MMKIGIGIGDIAGAPAGVDGLIAQAKRAEADGFASGWFANIMGMDAIMAAALCARETKRIELGTAVMPTFPRHPHAMAQQALSAQAIAGGRFTLGIGLSHQIVIEGMLGLSFAKPYSHMKEYLAVLGPLIRSGSVSHWGNEYRVNAQLAVPGGKPCAILVAALAPKMLALTGREAEGTITWMTGPKTIREHTAPRIRGGGPGGTARAARGRWPADRGDEGRRRRARGGGAGVPRLRRAALVPRHARPRGCRGARRRRHRGRRERGGRAAPPPGRGGRDRLPGGAVRRAGRRRRRRAHARAAREARGGRRRLSPRMDRPLTVAEIDHVVIRCRDQARALDFYTRVLGLREERRLEAIGLIQLRAGAGMIDLVPADPPPSHEGRNVDHVCLGVDTPDMAALVRWLRAEGVA